MLLVAILFIGAAQDAIATHTCFPGDPDIDGDGLPDSCDPNMFFHDADFDSFTDSLETFVGTSPQDGCEFPPDIDGNGSVNILDVGALRPAFNSVADDPNYRARLDLDANEAINILDFGFLRLWFDDTCPFTLIPQATTAQLRSETRDIAWAPEWISNTASLSFENNPAFPTSCSELGRAGDHWSNSTNFDYSLAVGLDGSCVGVVADAMFFWRPLQSPPGQIVEATFIGFESIIGHECTEQDPCQVVGWAAIVLNEDSSAMVNDAVRRHAVFPHELGHVLGQGHPTVDFDPPCNAAPWTVMGVPLNCFLDFNIHWSRQNDVLLTNVKY